MGSVGKNKIALISVNNFKNNNFSIGSFKNSGGYWLYFGKDYLKFKNVELFLKDKFELIEISERLDKISDEIRDDYNNYIDDINRKNKDKFEWWFTPLSSRNIYISDVFQNICYLELVKDVCKEYCDNDLLIFVESYSTGMNIKKWAENEEDILIKLISRPYRGEFYCLFQAFFEIGKTIFKAFINYAFAKISKICSKNKGNKLDSFLEGKTALIDLFVYESNFGEGGSFSDRYFPGLETYLKKNNYNIIYHPSLAETKLNKSALYKKMRGNERFFIIGEDYLHISDYIKSLKLAVKAVTFSGNIPHFNGFDISFADKCENKWKCFDGIFKSILTYYKFLRLKSFIGNDTERIISWHENQLMDKALSMAVHEYFRNTEIIGVHHFIHYSNYLSLYPLDSEAESSMIPDVILTTGPFESDKLRKYLSLVPVTESAALRYLHLFNNDFNRIELSRDILVLLPYDRKDALEILMRIGEIVEELDLSSKVIVKCHPDYGKEILDPVFADKRYFGKIKFTDNKIEELIQSVAIVVSNASGSLVEAAVSGIPMILLAKFNALNLNPFNTNKYPNITVCYDQNSLKDSINKYLKYSFEEDKRSCEVGNNLMALFFTPESDEKMEIFVS